MDLLIGTLKLVLSFGIGSFIGEERELKHKSLGVRTIALVCVASTYITLLSMDLFPTETARVIAAILTGIGFLGAGAIIADGRSVKGLTTAALTWSMSIIGIGIGLGEYILSLVASLIIYLILVIGKRTKREPGAATPFSRLRKTYQR